MGHKKKGPAAGDGQVQEDFSRWDTKVLPSDNRVATPRQEPIRPQLIGWPGFSHASHLKNPTWGEASDSYPTVAVLNDRWRVIRCRTSIQWILQKRRGGSSSWRNRYFCRTREGLIQCAREYAGEIGGDALVILLRLPERFPEGAP